MNRAVGCAVGASALLLAAALPGCAPKDAVPTQVPTGADRATPTEAGSPTAPPTAPSTARTMTPRTRPPQAAPPAYSTWVRGVHVLPRTADGYGVVRPTPPSLRERRYPTTDLLTPPAGGRWAAQVGPVTPEVRRRMGDTWRPGCPVPLSGLRYLTVSFRGFDGAAHTGELVVNATEAAHVVSVFHTLYRVGFPIEEMRLPGTADLDAPPTGDGNDTAAFVCRPTTGATTTFSAHAYGLAVDVDPFDNPYVSGGLVLPERASSYLDRGHRRPGMVEPDDVVVRAFARVGWSWGGDFGSVKDYQHFTATGR